MTKRILLIEDDAAERKLFTTVLEEAGFEVLQAQNGVEALQIARRQSCDLAISDIFMPEKTGFETIFDLKTEFPHLKIIAISGGAASSFGGEIWSRYHGSLEAGKSLETARGFGADSVLHKPIKLRNLLSMVMELLQIRDRRPYLNLLEHTPKAEISPSDESPTRILIIDDDESLRALFKTTLEEAGYDVDDAPDGAGGIRLYAERPYALVILDIFMPGEDGIETIFDLKTQYPGAKILAVSGGGSWMQYGRNLTADDSLEVARRFGAARTLKKPIKLQKLLQIVKELLKEQQKE